eukprot:1386226-Prymnesium_polylepis.1
MSHLHATRAFDKAPLHPSLILPATAPQRPSEAMPLSLAEKGVRCVPPINDVRAAAQAAALRSPSSLV